jgi:uncharacterized membrane protein AbrB (regulator of aidB expression)
MVSTAAAGAAVVMVTLPAEPMLNAGRSVAPAGLDVIAAVSTTLPVNPPYGATVIVD